MWPIVFWNLSNLTGFMCPQNFLNQKAITSKLITNLLPCSSHPAEELRLWTIDINVNLCSIHAHGWPYFSVPFNNFSHSWIALNPNPG
jgi:hypothetical protein